MKEIYEIEKNELVTKNLNNNDYQNDIHNKELDHLKESFHLRERELLEEIENMRRAHEQALTSKEEQMHRMLAEEKHKYVEIIQKMQKNKSAEIEAELNNRMES